MEKKKNFIKSLILGIIIVIYWVNYTIGMNAISPEAAGHCFDPVFYAANNPDVVNVYGDTEERLLEHYLEYGRYEGRSASKDFNLMSYRSLYVDLQDAFGDNLDAYSAHYLEYGVYEGRVAITENPPVFASVKSEDYIAIDIEEDEEAAEEIAKKKIDHVEGYKNADSESYYLEMAEQYDIDGNKLALYHYDIDGVLLNYSLWEYDVRLIDDELVHEASVFFYEGEESAYISELYQYYEESNIVHIWEYDSEEALLSHLMYVYDDNDCLIEYYSYDADDELLNCTTYEYDEREKTIFIQTSYPDINGEMKDFYQRQIYDHNRNIVLEYEYDEDGNEYESVRRVFYEGSLVAEYHYYSDGELRYSIFNEHDDEGNWISYAHHETYLTSVSEYDRDENLLSLDLYNENGVIDTSYFYEYTFFPEDDIDEIIKLDDLFIDDEDEMAEEVIDEEDFDEEDSNEVNDHELAAFRNHFTFTSQIFNIKPPSFMHI